MPEQSIASYISNLTSLGIMILIALFLFLAIFIISKILVRISKKNIKQDESRENGNLPLANKVVILNKDPNIFVSLGALSFFFLIFLIFIVLSLFFLIFRELINIKLSLFFIIFVLIFMIAASIYVVKSKIFK